MSEKLNRFINLLASIFELDKADLDFGIYRVMNIRKEEINEFLSSGLPKKVQEALAPFATDTEKVTSRIIEIEKQAAEIGFDISTSKLADEYRRLKSQLVAGTDLSALETDVYSALYNFFNRYYDEGDFISKRRYKKNVYAIPYEGEEVKLHWANADQYYIKTAENFRDYTFVTESKKVHFRLVDATTERNNNKEVNGNGRVFMLYTETADRPDMKTIEEVNGELVIRFVYDIPEDKKKKYAEDNLAVISTAIQTNFRDWLRLNDLASSAKNETRSLLEKHLTAYVAKNTFDYFIHKDLRGFLTRELDFFIKSEVLHLEDIDTTDEKRADSYLAKVRAIKRVGKIIIDFLAQIEDFQKKLWLKKKFVAATNWCVTLDRIDEAFYPEIRTNAAQIAEWVALYAIDEIQGDMAAAPYSEPLTVDFLCQNGNLVLDTRHFSEEFKDRLVASIDNLDEQTGGLMIHSENFQALGLLQERYRGKVDGIYIDPPYNTESNEIVYKNGYKDSSWLSLIADRLKLGNRLMKGEATECVMIDEAEEALLSILLSDSMPGYSIRPVIVEYNHRGRVKSNFSITHEYAIWAIPSGKDLITRQTEISDDIRRNLRRTGSDSTRQSNQGMFYAIEVDNTTLEILGVTEPLGLHDDIPEHDNPNTTMVYPIDDAGIERRWYYSKNRIMDDVQAGDVYAKRIAGKIQIHYHQEGKQKYRKSILQGTLMDSSTYGSELLNDIFGLGEVSFSFPKSINAVQWLLESMTYSQRAFFLDYFAGSGTTGHAVLNLNRNDNGNRKYILVEMGEYFNTVTLPRMKKVIYSAAWKNGKPQSRSTGVSHIMKYLALESYEDTLSNIELDNNSRQLRLQFGDEYLVRYMFDREAKSSMLNIDAFTRPFAYKLKINENNETKEKIVDVCETFNYLLGLSVIRQSAVAYFIAAPDPKGEYENAVILERNSDGQFGFKQIEGILPDGRRTLVIWRTITDDLLQSNAALDAYFAKQRINPADREFGVIFVNGDNNLENLRLDEENWKVQRIEPVFKAKMFEEE
ncbi:MAG: site-specific DNA-methyltransferase [Defluviitaleaceae bacterium]|nr:site-specific DNA-methyltransferase [Defluviitaleaceae bacterium]